MGAEQPVARVRVIPDAPPLGQLEPNVYSLNPPPGVREAFRARRAAIIQAGVPQGTLGNEKSSMKKWREHCSVWGTGSWRDNEDAYLTAGEARRDLLELAGSFIEWSYITMVPKKKGTIPKVDSAYGNWHDVSRVHTRDGGLPKLCSRILGAQVKGMCTMTRDQYGFEAVLVRRRESFTDREAAILFNPKDGQKLGNWIFTPESHFGLTWRVLTRMLNHAGFRKAEWAVRKRGDRTHMNFSQLVWRFVGQAELVRNPDPARLRSLRPGDYAMLYPVPSKCDPDGRHFCNKAIPFRFKPGDPDNTAHLFAQLELLVASEDRQATPLFADPQGEPFLGHQIDQALLDALRDHVTPAVLAKRSWHSWRVRLASKLRRAGVTDALILAMVRWRSLASLDIYARTEPSDHCDLLDRCEHLDITSVQFANLPEMDEYDRMDTLATTDPGQAATGADAAGGSAAAPPAPAAPAVQPTAAAPAAPAAAPVAPLAAAPATAAAAAAPPQRPKRRAHDASLPAGWTEVVRITKAGVTEKTYHGPNHSKARSRADARRQAASGSGTNIAAAPAPAAAEQSAPWQLPPTYRSLSGRRES